MKYQITLKGPYRTYRCDGEDTLLRAALRAGLGFPYECNVGSCGTCKCRLMSGQVETIREDPPGLSAKDKERNVVLACQTRPLSDCGIQVILNETYEPRYQPTRFTATLREIVRLTDDMCEFRFRADGPAQFLPGQYALFDLPHLEGPRAYSMCNLPNREREWHFQIKKVKDGAATSILFDAINVGDEVTIDGPYGTAHLRTDGERDLVCIAGGSGLSPMVSIARAVALDPCFGHRRLHFFYGGRGPRDMCADAVLGDLPKFGSRILYYPAISEPDLDRCGEWRGATGLIHEVVERALGGALREHDVYMAGPPPMVEATMKMLVVREKVPMRQIHYDRFY